MLLDNGPAVWLIEIRDVLSDSGSCKQCHPVQCTMNMLVLEVQA